MTFKACAYIVTRVTIKKETNRIKLKLAHVFSDTIFISTSSSPQRTMSLTSHRTPFPSLLYKGPQSCDPQPSSVPRWKAGGLGSGNLLLCDVNETIKFQSPGPSDACRNSSSFFSPSERLPVPCSTLEEAQNGVVEEACCETHTLGVGKGSPAAVAGTENRKIVALRIQFSLYTLEGGSF